MNVQLGNPEEPVSDKTLREMMAELKRFNEARDWGQYHSPRNLAMALSVEAGELLELFLWSTDQGPQPALPERQEKLPDEVADVLITLLNLCARCGIDPVAAFERKLAANAERYPVEKARGSMRKYSEYPPESESPIQQAEEASGNGDPNDIG